MTWFSWLVLIAAVLLIGAVGLTTVGAMRWAEAMQRLTAHLETGRMPPSHARYDASELDHLPVPVQRYFRSVLTEDQPIVTAATIQMTGTFNLSATGDQWRRFTSRQRVTTRCPGFLWDARIAMLPGVTVRVVDSYIVGHGLLRATIVGLFTMADMRGGGDIARGERMRYFFAEAVWYPDCAAAQPGRAMGGR